MQSSERTVPLQGGRHRPQVRQVRQQILEFPEAHWYTDLHKQLKSIIIMFTTFSDSKTSNGCQR